MKRYTRTFESYSAHEEELVFEDADRISLEALYALMTVVGEGELWPGDETWFLNEGTTSVKRRPDGRVTSFRVEISWSPEPPRSWIRYGGIQANERTYAAVNADGWVVIDTPGSQKLVFRPTSTSILITSRELVNEINDTYGPINTAEMARNPTLRSVLVNDVIPGLDIEEWSEGTDLETLIDYLGLSEWAPELVTDLKRRREVFVKTEHGRDMFGV